MFTLLVINFKVKEYNFIGVFSKYLSAATETLFSCLSVENSLFLWECNTSCCFEVLIYTVVVLLKIYIS